MSRSTPATRKRHDAGMARALAFIETHLDQRLDAARVAREAAMSTHHFHRIFSAHLGLSVGAYVAARRLQRACALLRSGREPVLDVALAVGYESAQSLAKVMRRELDATPTEVRRGGAGPWSRLLALPRPAATLTPAGVPMMEPHRYAAVAPGRYALTATARGMVDHTLARAARAAFGELYPAVARAGALPRATVWLAINPDDPRAPDDPDCRYVAGVVFDRTLEETAAAPPRPRIELGGSLGWWPIDAGPAAVFLHRGPYDTLHRTWRSIYRDWVPASARRLRDAPPFEVMLNDPELTPAAELLTEIWIPLQAR